jgi:hypothetical protein
MFPEACGRYGALTLPFSVAESVALLTVISARSVELAVLVEVPFVIPISVVFCESDSDEEVVMVELLS